jgi:acyl-CoA synthetase (NDP forming)
MCVWLLASLNSLRARYPERLIVLSMTAPAGVVRKFEQAGFLVFEDTDRALIAVAALCRFGESFLHGATGQAARDDFAPPQTMPAELNEHTAKKILGGAGISIWPETFARNVGEVRAAAAAFATKVAIKIVSPTILHKSEAGGVALAIRAEDAESTAHHMLERIGREHPEAQIDGFVVSPMCEGGVETICGTIRDPVFGPVVMFGLGGVFVEVLGDVTFRMAPIGLAEAKAMIDEVRGRKMLAGVRGQPAVDVEALARALVDLSKFAYRYREQVSEIDINPLRVMEKGAVALDALITRG